jgi:hypothetical protein
MVSSCANLVALVFGFIFSSQALLFVFLLDFLKLSSKGSLGWFETKETLLELLPPMINSCANLFSLDSRFVFSSCALLFEFL